MEKVEDCFVSYFTDIFSSCRPKAKNLNQILQHVLFSVTKGMNAKLIASFERAKIEHANKANEFDEGFRSR